MRVWINGRPHDLAEPATVSDALAALGAPSVGIAVAVNGEVVPKAGWEDYPLPAEAKVEVLTAVQGG